MDDDSHEPMFTGAELALADALILIIKVMTMHGAIDAGAIDTVFSDLENRYRRLRLDTAAAMANYLREHGAGADPEVFLSGLLGSGPQGSA